MMIIDDWLEDRIDERGRSLGYAEDPAEFSMLAGALRAEAVAAGYDVALLENLCGGDIATYLLARQATQSTERLRVSSFL